MYLVSLETCGLPNNGNHQLPVTGIKRDRVRIPKAKSTRHDTGMFYDIYRLCLPTQWAAEISSFSQILSPQTRPCPCAPAQAVKGLQWALLSFSIASDDDDAKEKVSFQSFQALFLENVFDKIKKKRRQVAVNIWFVISNSTSETAESELFNYIWKFCLNCDCLVSLLLNQCLGV